MRRPFWILFLAAGLLPGTAGAFELQPFLGYATLAEADCGDSASAPTFGIKGGGGGNETQVGVIFSSTSVGGGACDIDISLTDIGLYMNFALNDDPSGENAWGLGLEGAYTSCTIDGPPGTDYDLCTGGWVGGNLFYSRRLSTSETGYESGSVWYPSRMIYLTFAVGYRAGSASYDDVNSNTTVDVSTTGPYALVGLNLRFNLKPKPSY